HQQGSRRCEHPEAFVHCGSCSRDLAIELNPQRRCRQAPNDIGRGLRPSRRGTHAIIKSTAAAGDDWKKRTPITLSLPAGTSIRYFPIEAKNTANTPSMTITKKIDLTTDTVVCRPSDSALPLTWRPSTHATMPIASAMNGALVIPTMK